MSQDWREGVAACICNADILNAVGCICHADERRAMLRDEGGGTTGHAAEKDAACTCVENIQRYAAYADLVMRDCPAHP